MTFFHLAGQTLAKGSVIGPGNWGRVIRQAGWRHNLAVREMALEAVRLARFPDKPSRLDSAFVFLTIDEAKRFRQSGTGFDFHVLYRISLQDHSARSFITDWRLVNPQGDLRADWADTYWQGVSETGLAGNIPGTDWIAVAGPTPNREMLTESSLIVEEILD